MTKRHTMQPNGVWTYEVTLDPAETAHNPALIDTATPRRVPEASVVPCLSPNHMASWLTIIGAEWGNDATL